MNQNINKILLIGIDAASWDIIIRLIKKGKLPAIKNLMVNGVFGNLTTIDPNQSPIIWTSMATGKVKKKHGIDRFVTEIEGKQIPLTSNLRKTKAIWNILSAQGKSVSVVGWWNTWPAEHVNGTIVSSYVKERIRLGKGYVYPDIPHQTHPPELFSEIRPLLQSGAKDGRKIFHRIVGSPPQSMINPARERMLKNIELNCLRDETFTQISLYLKRTYDPNFLTVYLGGIDNVGHRFWQYMQPGVLNFQVSRNEQRVFGRIIPNYYEYIDQAIGRIVKAFSKDTLIIIISDHGMHATYPYGPDGNTGTHRGDDPGIFIISGPQIKAFRYSALINNVQNAMRRFIARYIERRIWLFDDAEWFRAIQLWKGNEQIVYDYNTRSKKRQILGLVVHMLSRLGLHKQVTIFDISPTILYAFGLAVPADMDGRVITEVFNPNFLRLNTLSYIDSYEDAKGTMDDQPIESIVDQAIIEKLRGLGYIE